MDKKQEEFLKKLLEEFKVEAAEHYRIIVGGLLELEKNPPVEKQRGILETVFREAHSLKGAARAVNLSQVEQLCQHLESVFAGYKKGEFTPAPGLFDALHGALDLLNILLTNESPAEAHILNEVILILEKAGKGDPPDPSPAMPRITDAIPAGDTVRISISRLGGLLLQVEELTVSKLAGRELAVSIGKLQTRMAGWRKTWDYALNQKPAFALQAPEEFPGSLTDMFSAIDDDLKGLTRKMKQEHRMFERIIDSLVEDMKKTLMFPFSAALDVIPKLVRDLSHDSGKEVELLINGGEIEMDRRILEEIKDPMVHLVRNCIDYGIESPGTRRAMHKPARGTIAITVFQKESRRIEIAVSDDGAGIDTDLVRTAAVKAGVLTGETANKITESGLLNLIFHSGLSTNPIITDISGRGLGLAIVQEKVEKLGGSISVETAAGSGTTFRMLLPVTLAAFRGVIVAAGGQSFVIPLNNVDRIIRVRPEDIRTVENRNTIELNGEVIGLADLSETLGLAQRQTPAPAGKYAPVLVLSFTRKRMAFLAEEVLGEHEGLIKNLGALLKRVRNIAGATVSGSGKIMPIIDIGDLIESAIHQSPAAGLYGKDREVIGKERSILVAEDSITARTLLKNIMESAGYAVKTAVDGIDALTMLRTGEFDLLVSDVDMPRMNGFDLTARIRADKHLNELPVVLVTALESREDRERGIDAGANAYIVKSGFDQTNLLEVIRRLV